MTRDFRPGDVVYIDGWRKATVTTPSPWRPANGRSYALRLGGASWADTPSIVARERVYGLPIDRTCPMCGHRSLSLPANGTQRCLFADCGAEVSHG